MYNTGQCTVQHVVKSLHIHFQIYIFSYVTVYERGHNYVLTHCCCIYNVKVNIHETSPIRAGPGPFIFSAAA